jgi:hypothetical protein
MEKLVSTERRLNIERPSARNSYGGRPSLPILDVQIGVAGILLCIDDQ